MFGKLMRLLRTLRWVPWRQLWARVRYRALVPYYASPLYGSWGLLRGAPLVERLDLRVVPPRWDAGNVAAGHAVGRGEWNFVGHTVRLGVAGQLGWVGWNPNDVSMLWKFNLHYHEWLDDLRAANEGAAARALVADWLVACGHFEAVSWHPYPLSLRVVRWLVHVGWLLEVADIDFGRALAANLHKQVRHLRGNLELDLGANHLLKNLKALAFVQVCVPEMLDGDRVDWVGRFVRELAAQVHADGGHYEASPHYQAQVLEDTVEVQLLLRKAGRKDVRLDALVMRLGAALGFYTAPNGELTLMNDSARGQVARLERLVRQSGAEEVPDVLPQTGYVRLQRGGLWVMLDAGRVGPDSNPGHAHADLLSMEVCVGREWLIVNGGTGGYQHAERLKLRQTAAHSAAVLAGCDSAEVWGSHRVGRRPHGVGFEVGEEAGTVGVRAWHDGYAHAGVLHERRLWLNAVGSVLRGEDTLACAKGSHKARVQWLLAPEVGVQAVDEHTVRLTLGSGERWELAVVSGQRLEVKTARYAPQWGPEGETKMLVAQLRLQGGKEGVVRWELGMRDIGG